MLRHKILREMQNWAKKAYVTDSGLNAVAEAEALGRLTAYQSLLDMTYEDVKEAFDE